MEKNKKIISIAVILIVLAVLGGGAGLYQTKEANSKDCRFLQTYGCLNYVPGEENDCSLAFITKGRTNDLSKGNIDFKVQSSNIVITNLQLSKSVKAGAYTLWNIYFKYEATDFQPGDEDLCISDVVLNGEKLSIGDLYLHAVEQRGSTDEIHTLGSSAASSGTKCSEFFAILQNQGKAVCNVKKIEAPHFSNLLVGFEEGEGVISEKTTELKDTVSLEAGKTYTMTVSFEQSELPKNAQLFYASPLVNYETDGKKQTMAFGSFSCGLNITEDELKQYGDTLF